MTGTKYSYAVTQLENDGVLHPEAHIFLQEDFYQAEPDVVTAVMTQFSLKKGLKEWGDKAYEAAVAEMKQLRFRNTYWTCGIILAGRTTYFYRGRPGIDSIEGHPSQDVTISKRDHLKLGHVTTSTRPSATALPGSPVSGAL
jgi:hypothetical protein